jgi:MFS family permease/SAM-dependent methyltransferase
MGSTPAPLPIARLAGVGAVVFVANAALLVLQLVAGRLLAPFVGSSLETWTSVIGIFLTGIALGNGLGGKLADRYPTPRTLAVLLILGAVAALWMVLFPMLLKSTELYKPIPLGLRIPLLTVVLCLPAGLMLSLLTPLAIKLGLPDVAHTGRVAGMVFALSTLGCLIGNYVTGFYLIPAFSINTLVLVAAGTLAVLAVGTMVVLQVDPPANEPVAPPETVGERETNPFAFSDIRQAYLVVFLASFGGMTLELTASRMIAQYLGVSLFTWTGVIGVMLAGTALGNFTGGVLADQVNRPGSGINPRSALAVTLLFGGAGTVLILVALALVTNGELFREYGLIWQVVGWTFALYFLPMYVLGAVSPQVIRLAVPDVAHVGRVAGRVYAWSTVGAIVGTFAAGYLLLSTLGINGTVLGVSLVLTLTSLIVARVWESNPMLYLFSIVLGGVCGGMILTARGNRDPGLVEIVETNYYTIKVSDAGTQYRPNLRHLNLDHLLHSTVDLDDPLYLQYTHEYVQVELLRAAREQTPQPRVLLIGGGGYTFPRYAKEVLPETQLDVVEIDPGVTRVAYRTLGLKKEYGINDINMDGRQFVSEKAAPGTYDLVVQDAVNDLSVPAHLLTKEYNDEVRRVLKPDGVFLLTVIDSVKYGKLWKAAMRTLRETFPHVALLTVARKADEAWNPANREVYVIYAADHPFDAAALQTAVTHQLYPGLDAWGGVLGSPPVAVELSRLPRIHTEEIPDESLAPFLEGDPGVLLTDQYAPVDNLMADVFRHRNRLPE